MRAAFYTLGCKVNQYDTQTMIERFSRAGYEIVPFEEISDVYLINTCTVTAVSDKKSRQMISRAHSRNPDAIIVVAGCYAQRDAAAVLALPGVKIALGNEQRSKVVEYVEEILSGQSSFSAVGNILEAREFEELSAKCDGRTRAHLKIQEGCNRFCSYCIIPFARGPIRSRSISGIEREVGKLTEQGFSEFVLTGINLASYHTDEGHTLVDAMLAVVNTPGVERVRLGSLEPGTLTDEFIDFCSRTKSICRHFHVSLQSGSNSVLSRMNRHYSSEYYAERIAALRKVLPNSAITTDIIAGFPGETQKEHEETLSFIDKIGFARIHVFPFSAREGTVAAKMPGQLPANVKEARARELIAAGQKCEQAYIDSFIGTQVEVLVEECIQGISSGYTDTYIHVKIDSEMHCGSIQKVVIIERAEQSAIAALSNHTN